MSIAEGVFGGVVECVLDDIKSRFPRVDETIDSLRKAMKEGFLYAASKGEAATDVVLWVEVSDITTEEAWAFAHLGFVMTRAPGDLRNVKIFARPSKEYAFLYKMSSTPSSEGGASGVKI